MGDMGAWRQTEMGAVGVGGERWAGGREREHGRDEDEECSTAPVGTGGHISIKKANKQKCKFRE